MKTAVLLMAYGAPGSLDEVEPFLMDVLNRSSLPAAMVQTSRQRYSLIGGKSPLLDITRRQAAALEQMLNRDDRNGNTFRVYLGMKHWHPRIDETVAVMLQDGFDQAVALVMTPQYSSLSVGDYFRRLDNALERAGCTSVLRRVTNWHVQPHFIKAVAQNIQASCAGLSAAEQGRAALLFTAHSLPLSGLPAGDPYPVQVHETAVRVAEELGWPAERWWAGYQSAGHGAGAWLGPHMEDQIDACLHSGFEHILITPLGFVCDHIETLYDLDIETRRVIEAHGAHLLRVRSLNDDALFIQALAEIIVGENQNEAI
jgi:ferrochelatase